MTLRVGVIGTGAMGSAHVQTLRTLGDAAVVAVSDADLDRAKAVADAETRVVEAAEDLITASEVDAVLIAAPDEAHEPLVLACLDAGKPVLCEKPLAATVDGGRRIVQREVALGSRLVQVGYMRRFDPAYVELKQTVRDGRVGTPLLLHCAHRNAVAMPWFTPEMPILNSAVHEFDVIRWLLDDDIARVTAFTPRSSSLAAAGLTDPRLLVVETTGGVLADIEIFVNAQYGYDVRCELVGETNTASLAPTPAVADFRHRFADAYRRQLQAWITAVATGGVCGASAWDGYAAGVTAQTCLQAAEERRTVAVTLPPRPALYESPTEEPCVTTPSGAPI